MHNLGKCVILSSTRKNKIVDFLMNLPSPYNPYNELRVTANSSSVNVYGSSSHPEDSVIQFNLWSLGWLVTLDTTKDYDLYTVTSPYPIFSNQLEELKQSLEIAYGLSDES